MFHLNNSRILFDNIAGVHSLDYGLDRIAVATDAVYGTLRQLQQQFDQLYGRLNVALERPAFSSGVYIYPEGGPRSPSKAVDGNKDPRSNRVDGSCFGSGHQDNPWWAVDLGTAVSVIGILFTNRGDCCGNVLLPK